MNVLAVIPARMGSKRIPGKNLRPLGGKPLVCWTIEAAKAAARVTRVCVTSESGDVLGLASRHEVDLIRRPEALAGDDVPAARAVVHALRQYPADAFDAVCMLLPTSPFRTARHIDGAIDRWARRRGQAPHDQDASVVSVTNLVGETRTARRFYAGYLATLDGDPMLYRSNGAVQVASATVLRRYGTFHRYAVPYLMGPDVGLDIDTPRDWAVAEYLVNERRRAA